MARVKGTRSIDTLVNVYICTNLYIYGHRFIYVRVLYDYLSISLSENLNCLSDQLLMLALPPDVSTETTGECRSDTLSCGIGKWPITAWGCQVCNMRKRRRRDNDRKEGMWVTSQKDQREWQDISEIEWKKVPRISEKIMTDFISVCVYVCVRERERERERERAGDILLKMWRDKKNSLRNKSVDYWGKNPTNSPNIYIYIYIYIYIWSS